VDLVEILYNGHAFDERGAVGKDESRNSLDEICITMLGLSFL
jgi:hypothetical protein